MTRPRGKWENEDHRHPVACRPCGWVRELRRGDYESGRWSNLRMGKQAHHMREGLAGRFVVASEGRLVPVARRARLARPRSHVSSCV